MEDYEWRRGPYKNLSLRVLPGGKVRVTSPRFLPRIVVDLFVTSRAQWIARARQGMTPEDLQLVSVWGNVLPLRVVSPGRLPRVLFEPGAQEVTLRVPATWNAAQHKKILDQWEKARVEAALETLLPAWEAKTGLKAERWTVKRLRSRWGSCHPLKKSLVFNGRLGSYPSICLEYVVVHELVHLIEPSHNARFHALVKGWFPDASEARRLLKHAGSSSGPSGFAVSQADLAKAEAKKAP